jgi:uncharacterized membrane protein
VIGGGLLFRRTDEPEPLEAPEVERTRGWRTLSRRIRPGVVFPVTAAFCYAAADLIGKVSLDEADADAGLGAVISVGTALAAWGLAHLAAPLRRRFRIGPRVGWLAAAGACMGLAILSLFHALDGGDVAVVVPIVACQPLIVFLLSRLLLQDLERLRWATVTAGTLVVAGTILVSQ